MSTSAAERLAALKAEIKALEQSAVDELMEKRNALAAEIADIDAELASITGKTPEKKSRRQSKLPAPKSIPLQELKELLAEAPNKTLSIRKEGLELRNIKTLAQANPHLLQIGGKGPWPTVTLLK